MTLARREAGDDATPLQRAFVAIRMPPAVCSALRSAQERLRRVGAKVGWTAPDDFHLTLWFIGDMSAEQRAPLCGALDEIAARTERFEFEVAGAGFFGPPRAPRILWAGVPSEPPPLAALAEEVRNWGRSAGWAVEERPFRAHITLGRVRDPAGADALTAAIGSLSSTVFGRVAVDRLTLMASSLAPQGARYAIVHESLLKG